MKNRKYQVYLTQEEYKKVMESLVFKKNQLLSTGHYTDGVDELLIKLSRPKIRNMKVVYTG